MPTEFVHRDVDVRKGYPEADKWKPDGRNWTGTYVTLSSYSLTDAGDDPAKVRTD